MDQRSRAEPSKESSKRVWGGEWQTTVDKVGSASQPQTPCPSSRGLHSPGGGTAAAVEMVGGTCGKEGGGEERRDKQNATRLGA